MADNRTRIFNLLLYPEDASHMTALDIIRERYDYLAILHDKDVDDDGNFKKPHYHVIVRFPAARTREALSKDLSIEPNYIANTASWAGSARYLIHFGLNDKYQYSPDSVEGNIKDRFFKLLRDVESEDVQFIRVMDLLDSIESKITMSAFLRILCNEGLYAVARRATSFVGALVAEHNQRYEDY